MLFDALKLSVGFQAAKFMHRFWPGFCVICYLSGVLGELFRVVFVISIFQGHLVGIQVLLQFRPDWSLLGRGCFPSLYRDFS